MIIYIDNETVAVFDTTDLATALADINVNYIYFGDNIVLANGLSINPAKSFLVFDGLYPLDGTGVIHQFTDMNSIWATDTLGVRAASSINLTFRNMSIEGRNYYGVPYIQDNANVAGVIVTYENVSYNGPQMIFNPYGTTRFFDCNITIAYPSDPARAEEVGEVSRVEMGGTVNINHTDTDDAVFWFRGNTGQQSFTVLENANVTINSQSYFMFAAVNIIVWVAMPVAYVLQPNSNLTLNTSYGISLNSTHQASTFLVDSGATFSYTQARANTTGTYHILYLNNSLTVNSGATFYMQADFATNSALIRFNAANASIHINNPKSCVLYTRGVDFSFSNSTTFEISGQQLNYWLNRTAFPTAGTFSDVPASKWHKSEYANDFLIGGSTTSTTTTVSSHNFTTDELAANSPLGNLHLYDARVLSVGNVLLEVKPIVDDRTPVTGTSDPNANIRLQYSGQTIFDAADSGGSFTVPTPEAIPIGTEVIVSANIPFLIIEKPFTVQEAGELILLFAPNLIRFMLNPISISPLLLPREYPAEPVEVYDSRVYSTPWALTATILSPLTTPSGRTLPDAVIYNDENGYTPLSNIPVTTYIGEPNDGEPKTTTCTWAATLGILAHITEPIYALERYTAYMHWEVEPIDEE